MKKKNKSNKKSSGFGIFKGAKPFIREEDILNR